MMQSGAELVRHCSFLLCYFYPTNLLDKMVKDIGLDLKEEAEAAGECVGGDREAAVEPNVVSVPVSAATDENSQQLEIMSHHGQGGPDPPPSVSTHRAEPALTASDPATRIDPAKQTDKRRLATSGVEGKVGDGDEQVKFRRTMVPRTTKVPAEPSRTGPMATTAEPAYGIAASTRSQLRRVPYTQTDASDDQSKKS
ncbi:hypothetical protein GQ600_16940 [Phytophthora cactorum]|nr:hypothetical protein GQ600_16940 [Phytophthora cactorum]